MIGPESIPFVRSTYHTPPEDKPDSVNVTVYFTSENVVESETGVPSTENVDEIGDGAYILFAEAIVFSKLRYVITFMETGLPLGVNWYVNGSGLSGYESSQANLLFSLANGTYSFTVTNLTSYYTTTTHFTVVISGKNVTENVDYYHWAYITGSISPVNANLDVNGKSVSLNSSGLFNITVPNGTYHVIISSSGYISYYINFSLNSGNAKNLIVSLVPISSPPVPSSIGLYVIIGVVIAIVVIGAAVALVKRRK